MKKEKVLEIEITKINNDWSAITITKLDETLEEENKMVKWNGYKDTEFDFNNKKIYINSYNPYQPFLISNENIRIAESIVNEINQKYGIPYRWRMRTETEIRDKLNEYEENIKFLETSLKNKEIIEELKRETVILKWVLGEIKKN